MTRQWHVFKLLCVGLLTLACVVWPARPAHAVVACTASMTNLNFGTVNLVAGTGLSTTATLNYKCTNDANSAVYARVCFNIGDGAQSLSNFNPRLMSNELKFQIYHTNGSAIWGSNGNSQVPNPYIVNMQIPAKSGAVNGQVTGSTSMQGQILSGQAAEVPGSYQNSFAGIHNSISWSSGPTAPANCTGIATNAAFDFSALASVVKGCTVVANSDIGLGTVSSTATNLAGNNSIAVTCSGSTPYFIGLAPSNGSNVGAGQMKGTGGNTDQVPYQLRSTAGTGGTIWGNTATTTNVGNGVSGTGDGGGRSINVYATVPSANYIPDTYTDTVTVNVNY